MSNTALFEMLIGKAAAGFGIAARQIEQVDPETRRALGRLFVQAFASGDANAYLKTRLKWIDDRQDTEERGAPPPGAPVEARFVPDDDETGPPRPARPRRAR